MDMRNPARIPPMLDVLQALWEQHPDMRFLQMVEWIMHEVESEVEYGGFYAEDDIVERVMVRLGVAEQDPRRS
jgi:uncharacterized protein YihD (DUF1040 family)